MTHWTDGQKSQAVAENLRSNPVRDIATLALAAWLPVLVLIWALK